METVYSVAEVMRFIRSTLEAEDLLAGLWVKGEISNLRRPSSGHIYFTLKDAGAALRCVMFRRENSQLKFAPEDGMGMLVYGRVSVYETSGDVQLYVSDIQPEGVGKLAQAFEQLKKKLQAEGLFDEARKKNIPEFPRRIGVLTSPSGAAVRDIITTVKKRWRHCDVIVIPASVQGADAGPTLIKGLKNAENLQLDVLIVARGGGSLEDLWAFNEEPLARALAACPVPTVTGVGHEPDITIADMVADHRAPTPTGAAAYVTPDTNELLQNVDDFKIRLAHALRGNFEDFKRRLNAVRASRVFKFPYELVLNYRQTLDDHAYKIQRQLQHHVAMKKEKFASMQSKLKSAVSFPILKQKLKEIHYKLTVHVKRNLDGKLKKMSLLSAKLHAMSPLQVLDRGYSVMRTADDKRIVKSVKHVKQGDRAEIFVTDGKVFCDVTETKEGFDT